MFVSFDGEDRVLCSSSSLKFMSCSTFVFPLNLLVVQKYIIPAVKRIYWCLLKCVMSGVPSSRTISIFVKKTLRKNCSLGFHTRWEIRYEFGRVSYFSSIEIIS